MKSGNSVVGLRSQIRKETTLIEISWSLLSLRHKRRIERKCKNRAYILQYYIIILHEPFILSETQILKISLKWMPDVNPHFLPQFSPKIVVISFSRQTTDILDDCILPTFIHIFHFISATPI